MRLDQGEKGASRGVQRLTTISPSTPARPSIQPMAAPESCRLVLKTSYTTKKKKKRIRSQLRPKSVLQPTDSDKDTLTQYLLLLRPVFFWLFCVVAHVSCQTSTTAAGPIPDTSFTMKKLSKDKRHKKREHEGKSPLPHQQLSVSPSRDVISSYSGPR